MRFSLNEHVSVGSYNINANQIWTFHTIKKCFEKKRSMFRGTQFSLSRLDNKNCVSRNVDLAKMKVARLLIIKLSLEKLKLNLKKIKGLLNRSEILTDPA